MYTVKSGYWLASLQRRRADPSTSDQSKDLWKWIWSLEVIPKVKMFMWKCLAEALPTNSALRKKSIDLDPMCRRCGNGFEMMEHALRDCVWMKVLWVVSPLRLPPIPEAEICPIQAWFERIRSVPHKESHATFAAIAWAAWYTRNLLVFQGKEMDHKECLTIAHRGTWPKTVCESPKCSMPTHIFCSRPGQLKVACDAAVVPNFGIGVGSILMDGEGSVQGCRYGAWRGAYTSLEGEALAVLEGLRLCAEKEATDVVVETDNQELYWSITRNETHLSYLGDSICEIRALVESLEHVEFSWTKREGNEMADKLASHALAGFFPILSHDVLPFDVNNGIG
ncbi:uncharacterized protein LOC131025953 [Salvia miltiorrhiza]|uniref:uncharacterized protein LOC131025953 n=1 Tax=Salvia miltiorrhiza TaxID=226208 RepID=UPI0025ACF0CC|nr:uncharacterized protein LOC131025953 [Salvia miltiorrhiza]